MGEEEEDEEEEDEKERTTKGRAVKKGLVAERLCRKAVDAIIMVTASKRISGRETKEKNEATAREARAPIFGQTARRQFAVSLVLDTDLRLLAAQHEKDCAVSLAVANSQDYRSIVLRTVQTMSEEEKTEPKEAATEETKPEEAGLAKDEEECAATFAPAVSHCLALPCARAPS